MLFFLKFEKCSKSSVLEFFVVKSFTTHIFTLPESFSLFFGHIPGLTSQRHSALISSDSEYFQVCFSAVHYLKISEQRWFSSEQRWKRKFSELKISAETALFSSETELIQSWTALIFSETALKLEIFRAKKSALNQSCFSADFLWHSAEKPKIQSKENQLWIRSCCLSVDFLQQTPDIKQKCRSQVFFRKFLRESLYLIFPGNLEIIPLWQKKRSYSLPADFL